MRKGILVFMVRLSRLMSLFLSAPSVCLIPLLSIPSKWAIISLDLNTFPLLYLLLMMMEAYSWFWGGIVALYNHFSHFWISMDLEHVAQSWRIFHPFFILRTWRDRLLLLCSCRFPWLCGLNCFPFFFLSSLLDFLFQWLFFMLEVTVVLLVHA